MNRIDKAFELFDAFNLQDPHKLLYEGVENPAEYFYSIQLYNWVKKLEPAASETLLLASRCQHIGRWKIPRDQYPAGKAGYLRWRTDLARFHADLASEFLKEAAYSEDEIKKVRHILLKENLKIDEEVQVMENALCLVFLEFQYEDFIRKHDDDKVVRILQKSWKKMSEPGRNAAFLLDLQGKAKELLLKAISK